MRRNGHQRGFTLIELMIVIVISAIVLAYGVPSFQSFIRNNRLVTETNNLLTDIQIARSEAIKRGAFVSMCISADVHAAEPICGGTDRNLDTGWIVFLDAQRPGTAGFGQRDDPANETLIRVGQPPAESSVSLRLATGSTVVNSLSFAANGLLQNGGTSSIIACAKNAKNDALGTATAAVPRRVITLRATGNASTVKDTDTSCTAV